MEKYRLTFFQLLLILLAIAFTLCIRYVSETENVGAGTFGKSDKSNITVSDVFERCMSTEDGK